MFDANNNMLPDLDGRSTGNYMFILDNDLPIVRPKYARWRSLLASAVLLVGLSGPLQALPENTHSGDVESSLNLHFSATTPITLSKIMAIARSEVSSEHKGPLEYDLNLEVASSGNAAAGLGNDFPSDTALTRESGNASRLLNGESGAVALGAPRVTLAAVTQSGADNLASNVGAVPTRSEEDGAEAKKLLGGEAARFPYATLTLAVLALLGLVSIERRDKIV